MNNETILLPFGKDCPASLRVFGCGPSLVQWNSNLRLALVAEGVLCVRLGNTDSIIEQGGLCLVNAGSILRAWTPENVKHTCLLELEILLAEVPGMKGTEKYNCVQAKGSDAWRFTELKHWFDLLRQNCEKEDKSPKSDYLRNKAFVNLILAELETNFAVRSAPDASGSLELAAQVCRYIERNYRKDLSLSALAQNFPITENALSKNFKRATGINVLDYIASVRFYHAYNELVTTDKLIKEISYDNGFPGTDAFLRLFRSKVGMTPAEYRKKWRA
jgi:xylan 1,4-beta-xylosidase